jgi:hypothetical protein
MDNVCARPWILSCVSLATVLTECNLFLSLTHDNIACAIFCGRKKGDYGGKPADYAFATYGIVFATSGIMAYYYAFRKEFLWHKLWAWRLYSLSLAAWMYRFDYYWWELLFGKGENSWLHSETFQYAIDLWINWMFYVPNLIGQYIVHEMLHTYQESKSKNMFAWLTISLWNLYM